MSMAAAASDTFVARVLRQTFALCLLVKLDLAFECQAVEA
jgi:hypothetical protein